MGNHTLGCNRHQQDYDIFLVGIPNLTDSFPRLGFDTLNGTAKFWSMEEKRSHIIKDAWWNHFMFHPIFNRNYIFKWWIFRCHGSFRGVDIFCQWTDSCELMLPSKAPKRFWSFIVHLYLQALTHLHKEYLVKTILDFLRFHLREKWLLHFFGFMLVFWDVNQIYEPLTIHVSSSKNHPSSSSLSSLQIHIRLHLSCMKHLQKVWDLLHEHGDRIACLQVLFFPDFYMWWPQDKRCIWWDY